MQEKTQFFCSLFQPIRKWIGGSFLFPVFPRRCGLRPSSPVRFPKFMCSSRKPRRVIAMAVISSLSFSRLYKYGADFHLWVIGRPRFHAKGQDFDENNVMQGLHSRYREKSSAGIRLTASLTAAREQERVNGTVVSVQLHRKGKTQESGLGSDDNTSHEHQSTVNNKSWHTNEACF